MIDSGIRKFSEMKLCENCKWHLVERRRAHHPLGRTIEYNYCYHPSITDSLPTSPVTGRRINLHIARLCNLIRTDSDHKCGPEGNLWEAP